MDGKKRAYPLFSPKSQILLEAGKKNALLHKDTTAKIESRLAQESRLTLEDCLREGARNMLQQAIGEEVNEHLENHRFLREEEGGCQMVVRNEKGHLRLL